ncbi:pyridoxamine 5'-phosphate oxidase family protein [Streptomyces sp. NPDC002793]|uniref:pyridoxamine 5'-phosphate oxidase family protein n=1 Tax=Streptomyces sp. NPDC002793 TaxID=3154432 RepID=UPI00332B4B1A
MLSSRPSGTGAATGICSSGPAGPPVSTASASSRSAASAPPLADKLRAIELLGSVRYGRLAMSMRALPFLAVARHLVIEGRVILRMHRGLGFHESCDGSVIAYGADNFNSSAAGDASGDLWSVQFTGPVEIVRPAPHQRGLFGAGPTEVNGEDFDPVYLRLDPQLAHMHTLIFDASP